MYRTLLNSIAASTLVFLFLTFASTVNAQDFAALDRAKSVEQLQKLWGEINTKLGELEGQIEKGATKEVKIEYRNMVDLANRLVTRLEAAAKGKLTSDRKSATATRVLMGISLDEASKDKDQRVLEIGDFLIGKGINPKYFEIASKSDRLTLAQREIFDELLIRHEEAMNNDLPRVLLKTTKGNIVIELFENEAPGTVGNFINLVEQGYYDNRLFHRVIEDFMAQSGGYRLEADKEVGGKGPGYDIKCECYSPDKRLHFSGSLSMAKKSKLRDTGSSEFFVTFARAAFLDGKHTCFGRVVSGFRVMENLERTAKINEYGEDVPFEGVLKDNIISATVMRKREHAYVPVKAEQKSDDETGNSENLELNAPGESDKLKSNDDDSDKNAAGG